MLFSFLFMSLAVGCSLAYRAFSSAPKTGTNMNMYEVLKCGSKMAMKAEKNLLLKK